MIVENYSQKYEKATVELWNRCCTFDPISVKKFRLQTLLDLNFDPVHAWIAIDGEKEVGFICATKRVFPYLERGCEPDRGWINVIFVDPEYRGRGIGQELYKKTEDQLRELKVKEITLGAYSPSYYFYGLDPDHYPESTAFFESNGYVAGEEHYSMGRDLHGYQIPEEIIEKKKHAEANGYRFVPFDYSYCLELLDFLKNEFGGGWKRNALLSMQKGTAEEIILLAIDPKGRICGFCMSAIDDNPMRFGPIGVAKNVRNDGIGSILLNMKFYEMEKQGIYRMYFVTTEKNAKRYYERNGLTVIRRFVDYHKNLD